MVVYPQHHHRYCCHIDFSRLPSFARLKFWIKFNTGRAAKLQGQQIKLKQNIMHYWWDWRPKGCSLGQISLSSSMRVHNSLLATAVCAVKLAAAFTYYTICGAAIKVIGKYYALQTRPHTYISTYNIYPAKWNHRTNDWKCEIQNLWPSKMKNVYVIDLCFEHHLINSFLGT